MLARRQRVLGRDAVVCPEGTLRAAQVQLSLDASGVTLACWRGWAAFSMPGLGLGEEKVQSQDRPNALAWLQAAGAAVLIHIN